MTRRCWGIYRESPHSPGRVDDDAAILEAVAGVLAADGFIVDLLTPDRLGVALAQPGAGIFAMCEGDGALSALADAAESGTPVVNSPAAIRNSYRIRMAELFARARVAAPPSWVVDTHTPGARPAPALGVKRADVHATEANDVMVAESDQAWREACASFAARGQGQAVVQAHAAGDLVKFYGVAGPAGKPDWFHWFYHAGQRIAGNVFDPTRLRDAAALAAATLGVEVYGGDAIVGAGGAIAVVDLNAWPSFARCRDEAAGHIACRLAHRFSPAATAPSFASAA